MDYISRLVLKVRGWVSSLSQKQFLLYVLTPWFALMAVLFDLKNWLIYFTVKSSGGIYNYFSFVHPDAMANIAPMLRDIIDGHWVISDGRILEYVSAPNLWSEWMPRVLSPILLLTQSVDASMLLGRFLFVTVAGIAMYFATVAVVRHRGFSFIFAGIFINATLLWNFFFIHNFENLRILVRSITWLGSPAGDPLLSRYNSLSVMPGLPFFAGGMLFIILSFVPYKRSYRNIFFAAACMAANMYLYLTNAMFLFVAVGMMGLLFLGYKKREQFTRAVIMVVTALFLSIGYFISYFKINALPHADEFYRRIGGELTHAFRFNFWPEYLVYIALALFVLWWGKKYKREIASMCVAGGVLAAPVLLNLQVVLGFNPTPQVWYVHQLFMGFYFGWMVVLFWLYTVVKNSRRPWLAPTLLVLFFVLVVSRSSYARYYAYSYSYSGHSMPPAIAESMDWLNSNTPLDSVVMTPSTISNSLIPYKTHNRVFIPVAVTFPGPISEITERFFIAFRLYGVDSDFIERGMNRDLNEYIDDFARLQENSLNTYMFDAYHFGTELNDTLTKRYRTPSPAIIADYIAEYESIPYEPEALLGAHAVDYLYIGPYEKRYSNLPETVDYAEKVFDNDAVQIYKIR